MSSCFEPRHRKIMLENIALSVIFYADGAYINVSVGNAE